MLQELFDIPLLYTLGIALVLFTLQPLRVQRGNWAYQKALFAVAAPVLVITGLILLF